MQIFFLRELKSFKTYLKIAFSVVPHNSNIQGKVIVDFTNKVEITERWYMPGINVATKHLRLPRNLQFSFQIIKKIKSILIFAENPRKLLFANAVNTCFLNLPQNVNLLKVYYERFIGPAESGNQFDMIFILNFLLLPQIEIYLNKALRKELMIWNSLLIYFSQRSLSKWLFHLLLTNLLWLR